MATDENVAPANMNKGGILRDFNKSNSRTSTCTGSWQCIMG